MITKIYLKNFRQFQSITIDLNKNKNIFIGSNGTGKSTILSAIDLVLSGSIKKIENITLESIFNSATILNCIAKKDNLNATELPELSIELYLYECGNHKTNGIHNKEKRVCDGLKLKIIPDEAFLNDILKMLKAKNNKIFPFEFYKIEFKTFADIPYNSYNKPFKHAYIDSSVASSTFAMKKFIQSNFINVTNDEERARINNLYREYGNEFNDKLSTNYKNLILDDYKIIADSKGENAFSKNISASKNGVYIEDMGKGEATLINIQYVLQKYAHDTDLILLEEPENHLSFTNMHKFIDQAEQYGNQLFISTHNDMIASRLDLTNAIFCHGGQVISLKSLDKNSANFFYKAPNQKILNFILSPKVILVEGSAEYLLLHYLYVKNYRREPYKDNLSIVECGGLTSHHYLEIAKLFLNKKVAVARDNDKNYDSNITKNYEEYRGENIEIFSDKSNDRHTFEICLYEDNSSFYETKIKNAKMTSGVLGFMLKNKVESAFRAVQELEKDSNLSFTTPSYISEAFEWIRK